MRFPQTNESRRNIMRVSTKFVLPLAALLFGMVLTPSSAWAATATKNCPPEPTQNVPIVSGETYSGTNCVLKTTGDMDSFTFSASAGSTWSMVAGLGANPLAADICLSLYAPGATTPMFSGCTSNFTDLLAVATNQKLAAGTYTIVITETINATVGYGVSLERISPAPSDATALVLSKNVADEVNPPTAQDAYTFYGATTGTYEIAASYTSGSPDVCFSVYQPAGTRVAGACTDTFRDIFTVKANVTPTVNGTYVVVVYESLNNRTVSYNLEVTCLLGTKCTTPPYPPCTLTDTATYNASTRTLTMNFKVGNDQGSTGPAATWSAWLTYDDTMVSVVNSVSEPSHADTVPPVAVTKTYSGLPVEGTVGVLSTLSTPLNGIACSSWVQIKTGTE
jgi:hypothetical protein